MSKKLLVMLGIVFLLGGCASGDYYDGGDARGGGSHSGHSH